MRDLGDLEAKVMTVLWQRDDPASVKDVLETLRRDRDLAYTTVMTVMDNLHRKGHLERERRGRAYLYATVRSREEHHARLMSESLDESADRSGTLMRFVGQMSAQEVTDLRRLLDAAETPPAELERG